MYVKDVLFQKIFQRLFVYNILFEDSEIDERYLGINDKSSVFSITGAGCGVAGFLSQNPNSVDAVDINKHHLALTCLKATATRYLTPYTTFYDFCGRGWHADPKSIVESLGSHLPHWAYKYWSKRYQRFGKSLYREGITSKMLWRIRKSAGLDENWLRELSALSQEDRVQAVEDKLIPILNQKIFQAFIKSPMQLIALGVNYSQKERLLSEGEEDMVAFVLEHIKKVAATELDTNWFAWHAIAGSFNHENKEAVPPYLRPAQYAKAQKSTTLMRYHNRNIFDVLNEADPDTWTHYTLCDAPDWLNEELQRKLLFEILRTSKDGAIFLYRTVEDDCMISRLGFEKHFQRKENISQLASEQDRSRQYEHVHFYEVCR